jgi:hypothetical protein
VKKVSDTGVVGFEMSKIAIPVVVPRNIFLSVRNIVSTSFIPNLAIEPPAPTPLPLTPEEAPEEFALSKKEMPPKKIDGIWKRITLHSILMALRKPIRAGD